MLRGREGVGGGRELGCWEGGCWEGWRVLGREVARVLIGRVLGWIDGVGEGVCWGGRELGCW